MDSLSPRKRPPLAEQSTTTFGDFLKQKCTGCTAWAFFGERELIKSVGLKTARKIPLRAGGLDGRLVRYDVW